MNASDTRHDGALASLRRVWAIALNTFGEARRMRLTILLGLVGAGLVLATRWLQEFNFGAAELNFISDFGLGALGLFGTLLAALATAQLFFSEITGGMVYCVLTRPVRRWEFVWGKFAGVAVLLALFTALLGALVALLLVWRGAQLGATGLSWPALVCACLVQWFKMTLVAAMTLLVCSYAGTALFASCAGLLLAVISHLRPFVGEGSRIGWLRAWPNLAWFDAESLLGADSAPAAALLAGMAGYWAVYILIIGGLAAYGFKHREF